jgi:lysyl oxidase
MKARWRLKTGAAVVAAGVVAGLTTYFAAANERTVGRPGTQTVAGTKTAPNPRQEPNPVPRRLPDLDQETPGQLAIKVSGKPDRTIYRLGFRSAVRNIGTGPLELVGSRPNRKTPYMSIAQLIEQLGRSPLVVREVGRMKYVISPDHRHWHYLDFEEYELMRYQLRRAGSTKALRTDHKTGFCLGDRYRIHRHLPAAPPEPVYTGRCALNHAERLRLRVGISVGYGDDYLAFLEGQDLRLSGLPGGRYVLVHRVNVDRLLRERSYRNNAASVLLSLRWRAGIPTVHVLARCPNSEHCDAAE